MRGKRFGDPGVPPRLLTRALDGVFGNVGARPHAGWRSAVIYSLIVSCRRRGINPETYLTDVLRRLPSLKITDIEALLPAHWQPPPGDTG